MYCVKEQQGSQFWLCSFCIQAGWKETWCWSASGRALKLVVKAGRKGALGLHSVLMGALGRQLLTDVSDSGKAQPWARLWAMSSAHLRWGWPTGCWTSQCQSCSWALTGRLSSILGQEKHHVEFNMTTHLSSSSLWLLFPPPALFPCGLTNVRWALEEQQLGLQWLRRGHWEHRDVVSKWNWSTEGTVRAEIWYCRKGDFKGCFWTEHMHEGWCWTNGAGRRCFQLEHNTGGFVTQNPLWDSATGRAACPWAPWGSGGDCQAWQT